MSIQKFIPHSLCNSIEQISFTWQTPSNIALVKYWGKSPIQIPENASISFTLSQSHTITTLEFTKSEGLESPTFELYFEGEKKDAFKPKIANFFDRIIDYCPYLLDYKIVIRSENSFPHSSGIASSASGMSAIAMCLMSLEKSLAKDELSDEFMRQKASFLARLGSGSASRSIEGPLVVWGEHKSIENSSDLYGIKFPLEVHSTFENYQDTILLVDKGEKQVSSTVGHQLMHHHPFAEQRFKQANDNLEKLTSYLQDGNIEGFIHLVESEALSLHAMMLTSHPYFILMKPHTLEIINAIWDFRKHTGSKLCFTLDAGANVHLLYPQLEKEKVLQFVEARLAQFCQKKQNICEHVGLGAKKT